MRIINKKITTMLAKVIYIILAVGVFYVVFNLPDCDMPMFRRWRENRKNRK